MRLHALFILTLCVLHARAASLPDNSLKKLQEVQTERGHSEQELTETNTIKDVDNKLKNIQTDIPVEVIVEDVQPVLKINNNEVETDEENYEVKRAEVDLRETGLPQHQEHDAQNPDEFDDEKLSETSIRQTLADTQNAFNQGLQSISQNLQNFFANNEQLTALQNTIQNMRESFTEQINKLNQTVQNFWKPQGSTRSTLNDENKNSALNKVQSDLRDLEEKFQTGLKSLAENAQKLSNFKSEENNQQPPNPGTTGTTGTNPNQNQNLNPFQAFVSSIQNFQQQIAQTFSSVTTNIQNFFNIPPNNTSANNSGTTSNQPGGQPANQGSSSPGNGNQQQGQPGNQGLGAIFNPAGIWNGIQSSVQSVFRPIQNQQGGSNQPQQQQQINIDPISQFIQGFTNLFNPNRPPIPPQSQPTQQPTTKPETKPEKPDKTVQKPDVDEDARIKPIQISQGSVTPVEQIRSAQDLDLKTIADEKDLTPKKHGGSGGPGDNNDSDGLKSAVELTEKRLGEDIAEEREKNVEVTLESDKTE